ncbi:PHP domain-containing protein, partial [bacterium]|nr:PHP domain-containing protein [bacterium]
MVYFFKVLKKLTLLFLLLFFLSPLPSLAANRPSYSGLFFYYGDLHAHSGYSHDGVGPPEEAYDTAKNNKNDFFALTEHDEAFIYNPYLCLEGVDNSQAGTPNFVCKNKVYVGTSQKWENLKQIASQKNIEGVFVALYGFEWTHSGGHLNVFEAPTFLTPPYSLESFYNFLASHPDRNTLFVQFNHPTSGFDFRLPPGNPDPDSIFTYNSSVASVAVLVETNQFASLYPKALKHGYKVGATGYGDGHNAYFAGSRRYGVLASGLNKEEIIKALKNHQTFGVLEGRAGSSYYPLAVALKVNNTLMGGKATHSGVINYEVYVKDELKDIAQLEIRYGGDYSVDYFILASYNNLGREKTVRGSFSNFAFGIPQRAKFVYAVVKQRDRTGK